MDNNVKMMGFGESILRSEKEDLVLFTYVGQGIGGVILSNGEIIRGIANAPERSATPSLIVPAPLQLRMRAV